LTDHQDGPSVPETQIELNCRAGRAIHRHTMDNKTALFLAAVIIGVLAADHLYFHWGLPLILTEKFAQLIEWTAFWR